MARSGRLFFAFLNLLGFLGVVVVNGLANTLPINGKTTGELSDLYPNLFVPAAITFSVWGVIYLLLGIFIVYQLLRSARHDAQSSFVERIGFLFFISSLANIGWIFTWHYELIFLSLILMLILLASLIAIYLRLDIGKSDAPAPERYLVHLPFSVYLGWITVATIANVTALLVDISWDRFGLSEAFWAGVVIAVAIAIALAVIFTRRDIFYGLVIDWALLGVLIKRLSETTVPDRAVEVITLVGLAVITIGIVFQLIRRDVYQSRRSSG